MRLLHIDIKGFKSFADKVTVQFDQGITGIVGPNGCGKSNIIDAIRWVLGEQSTRNLRSDKMMNVIFNGSSKRKPLPTAEVTLVMENDRGLLPKTYKTVSITRRYSRNGNSEYLINGNPSRRRDIANLLMNTGATSNSYAIIELRMVDEILTDKENARKVMFEEAAGIARFKARKKETLTKLNATQEDLERVEDLLHEIAKNMRSLEKQAQQAEKFYQTQERYEQLSIALAKKQIKETQDDLIEIRKQTEDLQNRKNQISEHLEIGEQDIDAQKKALDDKESLLETQRKKLGQIQHEIRKKEEEFRLQIQREQFLKERSEDLQQQLVQDREAIDKAQKDIQTLELTSKSLEKQLAEYQSRTQEEEQAFEKQKSIAEEARRVALKYQNKIATQQSLVYQLRKDLEIKASQLAGFEKEQEQLGIDFSGDSDALKKVKAEADNIAAILEVQQQKRIELDEESQQLQAQKQEAIQKLENMRQAQAGLQRRFDALNNEFELLDAMRRNMEGYSEAIKYLNKAEDWRSHALLLQDIITIKNEHYQPALQRLLEPWKDFYIVENENYALEAMQKLNDAKKGRAGFLVLDKIPKTDTKIAESQGGLIPAISQIEAPAQYMPLLNRILHEVFIIENENTDKQEFTNLPYTLVSLDGSYFQAAEKRIGGSAEVQKGSADLIGRKQKIEQLRKEAAEVEAQIEDLAYRLEAQKSQIEDITLQDPQTHIKELQTMINRYTQNKAALEAKAEQLEKNVNGNQVKTHAAEEKIQKLDKEIQKLKPALTEAQTELKKLEEEAEYSKERNESETHKLQTLQAAFNQANLQKVQLENQLEAAHKEINYKESSLQNNQKRIAKSQQELEEVQKEQEGLDTIQTTIKIALSEQKEQAEAQQKQVNQIADDFKKLKEWIADKEKSGKEMSRQKENLATQLMSLQNKENELKLRQTATRERLSAEFKLEITDELLESENREDKLSTTKLIEEIESTKRRLQRIGNINATAQEAFQEVKGRHDFIVKQRKDLLDAKNLLEKTIAELDEAAKITFLEAFEQIRGHFIDVFRSLFSAEDSCDLKLSNPEDPLESKIQIFAQPKGKRPLSIRQLSGGEKTLTATSLLFALYLFRPAPFCIFDEVDAPLDDANIDKFTRIIKRFSEKVQFIIVTHNKRTMVSTDVVYGVTIVEAGVSRLVPVDLRSLEVKA
ncbi:MAG: chromosome segregation protein SMC [Bernardetiaceae bacterium]|nr:chromosome segregation protein SMC [Bernardetiaceae bacterium]